MKVPCEQVTVNGCLSPPLENVTPSSISTPSPTPTTSLITIPEGSTCDANVLCEFGTGCNCLGYCTKVYTIRVDAIGDNHVTPFICGTALGPASAEWDSGVSYFYTGPCSDIYYHVLNTDGATGMVASVSTDNVTFTHTYEGEGLVVHEPPNEDFFTDSSYNFSSWTVPVISTILQSNFEWIVWMMGSFEHQGSVVWSNNNEVYGNNWYRQTLPFCNMPIV